jgi:hypothetical protein
LSGEKREGEQVVPLFGVTRTLEEMDVMTNTRKEDQIFMTCEFNSNASKP